MPTIVLLEKRTYLVRLAGLFKQQPELSVRELRRKIPSTTYYTILLAKLVAINELLTRAGMEYFIRPKFVKEGSRVLTALEKHPNVNIQITPDFVMLKYEDKECLPITSSK